MHDHIRPVGQRVLARRLKKSKMTAGGIHTPDTNEEGPIYLKIVAAGDQSKFEHGMTVMAGEFAGVSVGFPGDVEHFMLNDEEILAEIINPGDRFTD